MQQVGVRRDGRGEANNFHDPTYHARIFGDSIRPRVSSTFRQKLP